MLHRQSPADPHPFHKPLSHAKGRQSLFTLQCSAFYWISLLWRGAVLQVWSQGTLCGLVLSLWVGCGVEPNMSGCVLKRLYLRSHPAGLSVFVYYHMLIIHSIGVLAIFVHVHVIFNHFYPLPPLVLQPLLFPTSPPSSFMFLCMCEFHQEETKVL